jgi:hypothetical protein
VSSGGNDANLGTESAPWQTIGKVARTLAAGETAIVMGRIYIEPEVAFMVALKVAAGLAAPRTLMLLRVG